MFRMSISGLENIPSPPYIIAANHQAWFDPAFIIPFFPGAPMVYTMAKRETVFNRRWKRRLLPLVGVFPISPHRGELDEAGLRTVYQILERGGVVLIFPEGRYSRGRALRPLKVGIGHFALQAGVPISPVAVRGTDVLRPFSRVDVTIGRRSDPIHRLGGRSGRGSRRSSTTFSERSPRAFSGAGRDDPNASPLGLHLLSRALIRELCI